MNTRLTLPALLLPFLFALNGVEAFAAPTFAEVQQKIDSVISQENIVSSNFPWIYNDHMAAYGAAQARLDALLAGVDPSVALRKLELDALIAKSNAARTSVVSNFNAAKAAREQAETYVAFALLSLSSPALSDSFLNAAMIEANKADALISTSGNSMFDVLILTNDFWSFSNR